MERDKIKEEKARLKSIDDTILELKLIIERLEKLR